MCIWPYVIIGWHWLCFAENWLFHIMTQTVSVCLVVLRNGRARLGLTWVQQFNELCCFYSNILWYSHHTQCRKMKCWVLVPFVPHYSDIIKSAMSSQFTALLMFCSTVSSGTDQRKYQTFALLAFVRGVHRWLVNSPHKRPVRWKMLPFDDIIMNYGYAWLETYWDNGWMNDTCSWHRCMNWVDVNHNGPILRPSYLHNGIPILVRWHLYIESVLC